MPRPDDWKRADKRTPYVYVGGGVLWIRVTMTIAGRRRLEWGPRKCPEDWGTGRAGIAKAYLRACEIAQQMRDGELDHHAPVEETLRAFSIRYRASRQARQSTERVWWLTAEHWLGELGELAVRSIRQRDVVDWHRDWLTTNDHRSPAWRNNVVKTLGQVLGAATTEGLTPRNFADALHRESDRKPRRQNFRPEALLAGVGVWSVADVVYFCTLAVTGLRGGELRTGTVGDLVDGAFRVSADRSKTHQSRAVPIPSELQAPLRWWLDGQSRERQTYARAWSRAQMPDTPHALRRMATSELGALKYREALVDALTGHASRTMTQHYDGARGVEEVTEMVERYWAECVRGVYRQLTEAAHGKP